MSKLQKRVNFLEKQINTNEKYSGCEFELEVPVDGIGGGYFVRYPDGHREEIDRNLFDELTQSDTHFDIEIK